MGTGFAIFHVMVLVAVPLACHLGGRRVSGVITASGLAAAVLFLVSPLMGHLFPWQVMFDFMPPPGIPSHIYMNVYLFPYPAGATLPMAVVYLVLGGLGGPLFRGSCRRARVFGASFCGMHLSYLFLILKAPFLYLLVPVERFGERAWVFEMASVLGWGAVGGVVLGVVVYCVALVWPGQRVALG